MQMGTKARRQADALPSPEAIDVKRTALLLDVDGTLLDIAATPYSVVVPPSLRKILSGLIELSGGAVALVSGRSRLLMGSLPLSRLLPSADTARRYASLPTVQSCNGSRR